MDFSQLNIMKMMQTKIAYDSERQEKLSKNVSNIDTPGYMPVDLKPLDFKHMAGVESKRLEMRATQPLHMMNTRKDQGDFRAETQRKVFEKTPVKNGVVLEEQQFKVSQNQIDFQMTSNLYKKTSDMFRIAIDKQ